MSAIQQAILGRVGAQTGADGTNQSERLDKETAQVMSLLRGKYAEASERQQMFAACTAVGGQPWLATNTAAVMFDLFNPSNSGVRVEICRVSLAYVSGTLGAGSALHALSHVQGSTTPTGGTVITPVSLTAGKAGTTPVLAGNGRSLTATPTLCWPFVSSFAELATTANGLQQVTEDMEGALSIEPGGAYALVGVLGAAGTSPVVQIGVLFRTRPII